MGNSLVLFDGHADAFVLYMHTLWLCILQSPSSLKANRSVHGQDEALSRLLRVLFHCATFKALML